MTHTLKIQTLRPNVAALIRFQGSYVACCRSDYNSSWQCVQGGIEPTDTTPRAAIERELQEELGISPKHFKIIYQSQFWRRYYFTKSILAKKRFAHNIGQEQLWFLVEIDDFKNIHLNQSLGEFDKVELLSIPQLLNSYSHWKKSPFHDFCRELGLLVE
ncbi:MAG: NUDIX domain-containing protein [Bdellovibrionota bacterium]